MNPTHTNWREAQRFQTWPSKQNSWTQRQIIEALGVSKGAISQWMKHTREGGLDALRHRSPPGAPHRLSTEQLPRLPECL